MLIVPTTAVNVSASARPCSGSGSRSGFSLVELIAVLAIIMVLLSLIAPVLGSSRRQAEASVCMKNLQNLAMATSLYSIDHSGRLPFRYNPSLWSDALSGAYFHGQNFQCPARLRQDPLAIATVSSYGYSDWLEWTGSGYCPKLLANIPDPALTPFISDCDAYRFLRINDWQIWFWPVSRHSPTGPINWSAIGGYNANDPRQAGAPVSIGWGDGHVSLPRVAELMANPNWGQVFQACK